MPDHWLVGIVAPFGRMRGTPLHHANIAVVDDNDLVRGAVSSLLRSMGHRTHVFDCGDAFLSSGVVVDCVLTDLQMPGRSGLAVAAELASHDRPPRIILMTAHADPTLASRCEKLGFAALLEKPLDSKLLIAAVEKAIRR